MWASLAFLLLSCAAFPKGQVFSQKGIQAQTVQRKEVCKEACQDSERNNSSIREPSLTRSETETGASSHDKSSNETTDLSLTTHPVMVMNVSHQEPGIRDPNGTNVDKATTSAHPDTSLAINPSSGGPSLSVTTATTPQEQTRTEKTSLATLTTTALALSSEASTGQTGGPHGPNSPAETTVSKSEAMDGSASSPPSQALPTYSGISSTPSTQTPTKGGSLHGPSSPSVPVPPSALTLLTSRASAEALTSASMSTAASTKMEPTPTPTPTLPTPQATPTAVPTTDVQTTGVSGASQTPERVPLPTIPSTESPKVTAESSPTAPEPSAQTGTESPYIQIATSPLSQYAVNKTLLLAILLVGTFFFITVLVLLAMQAYESYKKKDYTQVDYLINGMYVDSEM